MCAKHLGGLLCALLTWKGCACATAQVSSLLDRALQLDAEETSKRLARDFARIGNSPLLEWSEHVLLDLLATRDIHSEGTLTEMEPTAADNQAMHSRRCVPSADRLAVALVSPHAVLYACLQVQGGRNRLF